MKVERILPLALLALLLSVAAGCNHSPDEGKTKVSGKVNLDGAPLATGTILFVSADPRTPTESAYGNIKDGNYSVAVSPGPKIVQITSEKVTGKTKRYEGSPNSPEVDKTEQILPARYNTKSDMKVDIGAGSQELQPYDLTSQ
jgi:hypothetical protein